MTTCHAFQFLHPAFMVDCGGHQRDLQIVGGMTRHARPRRGRRAANLPRLAFQPDAATPMPTASGFGNARAMVRNRAMSCAGVRSFMLVGPNSARRKARPCSSASSATVRVPPPSMPR